MSGVIEPTFPAIVTITQIAPPTAVIVESPPSSSVAPGVPPYPLSTNPAESWYLTVQNGVLAWVQSPGSPAALALLLQDAQGYFQLQDGIQAVLMEA